MAKAAAAKATTTSYMTKDEAGRTRERKQTVVDRELEAIYAEHGTVTAELLVEQATKPSHPLHAHFEWDDSVAATKYRLEQAYRLIQASKMVVVLGQAGKDPPKVLHAMPEVRRLVSAFRGEGFKMRKEVLDDTAGRKAFVDKKRGELRGWCASVIDVEELAPLRTTIAGMLEP